MSLEETWDTTEIAGDLVEQMTPNFMADNKSKNRFKHEIKKMPKPS